MATKKIAREETANHEVLITRVFNAPRDRVFQAWADPKRLMRWWGPRGFTSPSSKIDFRPGGRHLKGMRSPEGHLFWSAGVYTEIVAPERIAYTEFFSDAEGNPVSPAVHGMSAEWPGQMNVTVTFAEEAGKTRMSLRHDLGSAPAKECDMCKQGWSQSLDKLDEELKRTGKETQFQSFTTCLSFDSNGEEAARFYVSVFPNSRILGMTHYGKSASQASGRPEGSVMTVSFQLQGHHFMALNGGPAFPFSPSISLMVGCESQEELDKLWEKLSEGGEVLECGWLKDKYGLAWQIVPSVLGEMIHDPERSDRVMKSLVQMKKLDLATLVWAYEQGEK